MNGATFEAFREVQSVMVVTVEDLIAGLKKYYRGMQGGEDHQQERSLLPGHVREPSHHGDLQGVQCIIVYPGDDPLPFATPRANIFGETVKGSSIGPTIILRTP